MVSKETGRNPNATSLDNLGLLLKYVNSTGRQYEICSMFGFVPSIVSVWMDYGQTVLLEMSRTKAFHGFE